MRHAKKPADSAFPLGWVVLGGHRLPVTKVCLRDSGVVVEFALRGPLPPLAGNVTVYGEDGKGIWQGHEQRYPAIEAGRTWVCIYKLTMDSVDTHHEVNDFTGDGVH